MKRLSSIAAIAALLWVTPLTFGTKPASASDRYTYLECNGVFVNGSKRGRPHFVYIVLDEFNERARLAQNFNRMTKWNNDVTFNPKEIVINGPFGGVVWRVNRSNGRYTSGDKNVSLEISGVCEKISSPTLF